jgi:hypothetical protein
MSYLDTKNLMVIALLLPIFTVWLIAVYLSLKGTK